MSKIAKKQETKNDQVLFSLSVHRSKNEEKKKKDEGDDDTFILELLRVFLFSPSRNE